MLWVGDVVLPPFVDGVCGLVAGCGVGDGVGGDPPADVDGAGAGGGGGIAMDGAGGRKVAFAMKLMPPLQETTLSKTTSTSSAGRTVLCLKAVQKWVKKDQYTCTKSSVALTVEALMLFPQRLMARRSSP